jgi:DNA-binding MarR family transcriptional regulator
VLHMSHPPVDITPSPPDSTRIWCELAERLAIAARILQQDLGAAAEAHGLSPAQWSLLSLCARAPIDGWSQSEMARSLALSPAHVSQLVELLRQNGQLDGRRATYDRRRQVWQLTSPGRQVLDRLQADLAGWSLALDGRISPELRQSAGETLIPLVERLLGDAQGAFAHKPATLPSVSFDSRPGAAA